MSAHRRGRSRSPERSPDRNPPSRGSASPASPAPISPSAPPAMGRTQRRRALSHHRKQHDQQRPQVGDQPRLRRGRVLEREHVERVIAKQTRQSPAPMPPRGHRPQRRQALPARSSIGRLSSVARPKVSANHSNKRQAGRQRGQQRQRRPQHNGAKTEQALAWNRRILYAVLTL